MGLWYVLEPSIDWRKICQQQTTRVYIYNSLSFYLAFWKQTNEQNKTHKHKRFYPKYRGIQDLCAKRPQDKQFKICCWAFQFITHTLLRTCVTITVQKWWSATVQPSRNCWVNGSLQIQYSSWIFWYYSGILQSSTVFHSKMIPVFVLMFHETYHPIGDPHGIFEDLWIVEFFRRGASAVVPFAACFVSGLREGVYPCWMVYFMETPKISKKKMMMVVPYNLWFHNLLIKNLFFVGNIW